MKGKEVQDDENEEIFEDKSEEILAELREKSSGDFAIGPPSQSQFSKDLTVDGAQPDQTFSKFATEEVLNKRLGNVHRTLPILWLFPIASMLLLFVLVPLAFKANDELRPLQTNRMTSNERPERQTVGSQRNDDGFNSSRVVDSSIRNAKEPAAAMLAGLPTSDDLAGSGDASEAVQVTPSIKTPIKSIRQRQRASRAASYHRSQRAWHIPKPNLRFNATY